MHWGRSKSLPVAAERATARCAQGDGNRRHADGDRHACRRRSRWDAADGHAAAAITPTGYEEPRACSEQASSRVACTLNLPMRTSVLVFIGCCLAALALAAGDTVSAASVFLTGSLAIILHVPPARTVCQ